MAYYKTSAYKRIAQMCKRIRAVQGGTSASKTVSIVLWLIALAQSDKVATTTSIVSESFPHLRRGAMKEFLAIMKTHDYFVESRWDKTNSIYTFETGSTIEFFSVDQSEKVRGARRDRLFINEANNISFSAFEELEVRTKEFIFMDWNPVNEFWFDLDVKNKRTDVEFIILTYKDNEALSVEIIKSIEQRKNRPGWWNVYGLGKLGEVEGKIYNDWAIIADIPHAARLLRYGLDFGYTNDPTTVVAVYKLNDGIILDEICYENGMSNEMIKDTLLVVKKGIIIADSAEPKSIDQLKSFGLTVLPAIKGPGSVTAGINFVQEQRISVTARSVNIIREYRNYLWIVDKDGKVLNEPESGFDHTMDAIRYALAYDINHRPISRPWVKKEKKNVAR